MHQQILLLNLCRIEMIPWYCPGLAAQLSSELTMENVKGSRSPNVLVTLPVNTPIKGPAPRQPALPALALYYLFWKDVSVSGTQDARTELVNRALWSGHWVPGPGTIVCPNWQHSNCLHSSHSNSLKCMFVGSWLLSMYHNRFKLISFHVSQ